MSERERYLTLTSVLVVGLLLLTSLASQASDSVSCTYILYPDGHADIRIVYNVTGKDFVEIRLERGYVNESITVFSDNGMPLPYVLKPGGEIIVNTTYLSNVTVEYEAVVGVVLNEVQVNAVINPLGPAEVILPLNSALLYFNGSPRVTTVTDSSGKQFYIVLSYDKGGTYEVSFLLLPPTETTTTGAPGPQTSPQPSGGAVIPTILILALAGAAAVALLAFFILKRRLEKAPEIEPLLEYGFDERDKVILKTLGMGEATLSDLSKATGLNKSVVWRRLERLRELGYVEKIYSRGKYIYRLTEKGFKTLRELG